MVGSLAGSSEWLRRLSWVVVAALMVTVAPSSGALAQDNGGKPTVDRIGGGDRIATAVAASAEFFPDGATEVVLATAFNYPDALAAGPLARALDGPILLTRQDVVPDVVLVELSRLGAERVTIAGLQVAVSDQVALQLSVAGFEVRRIGGGDRFETARLISEEVGAPDGRVVVAQGRGATSDSGFADALTAGTYGITGLVLPTLLTETGGLPAVTSGALADLGPGRATIIGGPVAVSANVEAELGELVDEVERLEGPTRYATSVRAADAITEGLRRPVTVLVATGAAFPDALAAGALTGRLTSPIILVPPTLPAGDAAPGVRLTQFLPEVSDYLTDICPTVLRVVVLGLEGAVSAEVESGVDELLTCRKVPEPPEPEPTPTPTASPSVTPTPAPSPTPTPTQTPTPTPSPSPSPTPSPTSTPTPTPSVTPGAATVPDVVGDRQDTAITKIDDATLVPVLTGTEASMTVPAGRVIRQSPAPGARVDTGTDVTYVLSSGPTLVTVPEVVGFDEATARTAIEAAGLVVGSVGRTESDSVLPDQVDNQLPLEGQQVQAGSTVDVELATGQVNDPPTITSTPVTTYTISGPGFYNYDVDATDPDTDPVDTLTFVLQSGPDGMTVDAGSGQLSWTAADGFDGLVDVAVRVEDGNGGIDVQSYTIVVSLPNRAPTANDDQLTTLQDQDRVIPAVELTANDTDADGDALSISAFGQGRSGEVVQSGPQELTYIPNDPNDRDQFHTDFEISHAVPNTITVSPPSDFEPVLRLSDDYENETYRYVEGVLPTFSFTWDRDVAIRRMEVTAASGFGEQGFELRDFELRGLDAAGDEVFRIEDLEGPPAEDPADDADTFDEDFEVDLTAFNGGEPFTGVRTFQLVVTSFNPRSNQVVLREIDIFGDSDGAVFRPRVQWSSTRGIANHASPIAADLDQDGFPEVLHNTADGSLIALDGRDGSLVWEAPNASARGTPAAGDVADCPVGADPSCTDDQLEVAVSGGSDTPRSIRLLDARGDLLDEFDTGQQTVDMAIHLVDVDGDGTVEIATGGSSQVIVLDVDPATGSMSERWRSDPRGCGAGACRYAVVDVDLDGVLEIVLGNVSYDASTGVVERTDPTAQVGVIGVANFDDDPEGEIVRVDRGVLTVLNHDYSVLYGPLPLATNTDPDGSNFAGSGGPPTIADFDGDGRPEIGVAGAEVYAVYDLDLPVSDPPLRNEGVLWKNKTKDFSSSVTGSTVFDFDNDGSGEVVFHDETNLFIWDGPTGALRWSRPISSGTFMERPMVADVDADGEAELVASFEGARGDGTTVHPAGLHVYESPAHNWRDARDIWNQVTYHVTNVNADGSIPRVQRVNWLTGGLNDFNNQTFPPDESEQLDQFTYTVTDGAVTDQATVFIEAKPEENNPVVTCGPPSVATAGYAYSGRICADDPDGDPLTFEGVARPATTTQVDADGSPWLTGQPDGTTLNTDADQDVAPAQSPTVIGDGAVVGGQVVTFDVAGEALNSIFGGRLLSADGIECFGCVTEHALDDEFGIQDLRTTTGALVGVFTTDARPSAGDLLPPQLDQGPVATRNLPAYAPELRQPFTIGNGLSDTGVAQEFTVPGGATRLHLGTMVSSGWNRNSGSYTVTLIGPPTDLTVDADAGLVDWIPTLIGSHRLDAIVTDDTGRSTAARFPIEVQAPVQVPALIGELEDDAADAVVTAGLVVGGVREVSSSAAVGTVVEQFPPAGSTAAVGSRVSYAVSRGPDPADVDADGDGFTPNEGDCNDVAGAGEQINPDAAEVDDDGIDQDCDGEDGGLGVTDVAIRGSDVPLVVGQARTFQILARTGDGRLIEVFGSQATLTVSDTAVAQVTGDRTIRALATGPVVVTASFAGFQAGKSLTVVEAVPVDDVAPIADITTPAAGDEVGVSVDVVGTANDANLTGWTLTAVDAGGTVLREVARGTSPVISSVLGTFESSSVPAGQMTLRLDVEDAGGNISRVEVPVTVLEGPQVGAFELLFTDLVVDAAGLPIEVTRRYDSRDGRVGDFGAGWSLDLGGLDLSATPDQGLGWDLPVGRFSSTQLVPTSEHAVTVSFPDGREETFDLSPTPSVSNFAPLTRTNARYVPRFGTVGTLVPRGNTNLLVLSGGPDGVELVDDIDLHPYEPEGFVYTAPNGTEFTVDADGGVERIRDANGNTLTVTSSGITHSSGPSVVFGRDALGRISSVTDQEGHVQSYGYSAAGDLVSHTDLVGATTRYRYVAPHKLFEIVDPLGRTVERREYDEATGRLVAFVDGRGNRIELTHDVGARREIVRDADGFSTVVDYDERGNVLASTDQLGNTTTSTYDADDNQLTRTDPLGRTTSSTFDGRGNELTVTAPDGGVTILTYDASDRITSVTDPSGNTTTTTFDSRGNVLERRDPGGVLERTTYDDVGNVVTAVDAAGAETIRTYDANGRERSVRTPSGGTTTTDLDASGGIVATTSVLGATSSLTLDAADAPVAAVDADGNTTTILRGVTGRLEGVVDAGGNRVEVDFDVAGREIRSVDAVGGATTTTYTPEGDVATVTDPAGGVTTNTYDAANRLVAETDPTGAVTRYEYNTAGQRTAVVDPEGGRSTVEYADATGRVVATTDQTGGRTTYAYDTRGQVVSVTDPTNRTTTFSHDARGNQTGVTFPDTTTQTRIFDAAGRVTTETDGAGNTTSHRYDVLGNVVSTTDALGSVTTATYDLAGNLVAVIDAEGRATRHAYDVRGRRIATTFPSGEEETTTYDTVGDVDAMVDRNSDATDLTHDAAGRLVREDFADGTSRTTTWTAVGRVDRVSHAGSVVDHDHDGAGRVVARARVGADRLSYVRDGRGLVTSTVLTPVVGAAITTTYEYDATGRPTAVVDRTGGRATTTYDAAGRELVRTTPDGTTETRTYDTAGRVDLLTQASTSDLLVLDHDRDQVGNVISITTPQAPDATFTYDPLHRLTSEAHVGTPPRSYGYDRVGNRLSETVGGATTTSTYDADDRILARGGTTFLHDASGNLLSARTGGATDVAHGWDPQGRPTSTVVAGDVQRTTFDAVGDLARRTTSGDAVGYVVDPAAIGPVGQIVAETDGAGTVTAELVWDGDQVSERRAGVVSYLHHDARHDLRTATAADGSLLGRVTYLAFGEQLASTGQLPTHHRFAGQHQQDLTGLYDMRARTYDPTLGRFLSVDAHVGSLVDPIGMNPYEYARNNPLTNWDPTGELSSLAEGAIVSGLVSVVISITIDLLAGRSTGDILFNAVVNGALGAAGAGAAARFGGAVTSAIGKLGSQTVVALINSGLARFIVGAAKGLVATLFADIGARRANGSFTQGLGTGKFLSLWGLNTALETFFLGDVFRRSLDDAIVNNQLFGFLETGFEEFDDILVSVAFRAESKEALERVVADAFENIGSLPAVADAIFVWDTIRNSTRLTSALSVVLNSL